MASIHSLSEQAPPKFVQILKDKQARSEEKVQMSCRVVGQPTPQVIWYKDDKPIRDSEDFIVSRIAWCSFSSGFQIFNRLMFHKMRKSINHPAQMIPGRSDISRGKVLMKNRAKVFSLFLFESTIFQISTDGEQHTLTIPEVFSDDQGVYQARAVNLAGEAKCYSQLTVKPVPG